MGAAGSFDHWPTGWGFDHWWGFLTGAAGQYDPIITQDNSVVGRARGCRGRPALLLPRRHHRQDHRVAARACARTTARSPGSSTTPPAPRTPRTTSPRSGPTSTRASSTTAGTPTGEKTLERQKSLGIVPRGHRAHPAAGGLPGVGRAVRRGEAALRPADGGLRRLLGERRLERRTAARRDRADGRARRHPRDLHLGRQRGLHGGHAHRVVQRDHVLQRPRARRRASSSLSSRSTAASRSWAASTRPRTSRRRGRMPTTPRSSGASRWPATSAAPATRWSSPGRAGSRRTTRCAASSRTASTSCRRSSTSSACPAPTVVDGIEQEPMDGVSFAHTFDDAAGEERHTVQYFEMYGSRAIYKDGWWACTKLDKLPWDFSPPTLARFGPGSGLEPRRRRLGAVLPARRLLPGPQPRRREPREGRRAASSSSGRRPSATTCCRCSAGSRPSSGSCRRCPRRPATPTTATSRTSRRTMIPRIYGRSYAIEADVHVPEDGAEGVLVAFADFIGGFALWVDKAGYLHHTYQFLGVDTYKQSSTQPHPDRRRQPRRCCSRPTSRSPAPAGDVTLLANGDGDRRRADPAHGVAALHHLRRDGHRPRQRRGRRPRLRGPRPVRVHRAPSTTWCSTSSRTTLEDQAELHRTNAQAGLAHGAAG